MATANNYEDLLKLVNTNASALGGMYKGFDTTYNNYANQLVNNGSFQAIENARQNMTDSTNRQYNNAAKNYYTQYRINQNKLPEQLSNLGVTGGASETAQLGLMNNYSTNMYNNEQGRANALNTGNIQYDQMVAENSANIANQLASTYLSMAQQARENQMADAEVKRLAEQEAYERKQAEDAKAYERALQRAQSSGDFSAMKAFGWTAAEIKKANALYAGNSSGGSSGKSKSRSKGRKSSGYRYNYSKGKTNTSSEFPDVDEKEEPKTKAKTFTPNTTTAKYKETYGKTTVKKTYKPSATTSKYKETYGKTSSKKTTTKTVKGGGGKNKRMTK